MQSSFGSLIEEVSVGGIEIEYYSNYRYKVIPSSKHTYDDKGGYLGIKCHCIEFIRWHIYKLTKENIASKYNGNADWLWVNYTALGWSLGT